jgi:hypothetical protein
MDVVEDCVAIVGGGGGSDITEIPLEQTSTLLKVDAKSCSGATGKLVDSYSRPSTSPYRSMWPP